MTCLNSIILIWGHLCVALRLSFLARILIQVNVSRLMSTFPFVINPQKIEIGLSNQQCRKLTHQSQVLRLCLFFCLILLLFFCICIFFHLDFSLSHKEFVDNFQFLRWVNGIRVNGIWVNGIRVQVKRFSFEKVLHNKI